mgnify:FL=1
MSIDLASIDHNCNVIRRQIEDEFRGLSALFIVHKNNEREKTVIDKRNIILAKPHGQRIYDALLMTKEIHHNESGFLGIIINQNKIMGMKLKRHHTAVFFINADTFQIDENAKHHLYSLTWHALYSMDRINTRHANTEFPQSKLIKPATDKVSLSKNNLMADIFGAIIMESHGHKDFILQLAKRRSHETLQAVTKLHPHILPYPVAYEACKLVYEDLKGTIDIKARFMQQIMDLASEVSLTYGDNAIKQWWAFARPAQDMAWAGYSPEKILGNAIYTSEDTFVRALAYQIADLVEIEPDTTTDQGAYNPFASDDYNERIHRIKSDETGKRLTSIAVLQNSANLLFAEAQRHNKKLVTENACGWASHALHEAAQQFEDLFAQGIHISADDILKTYRDALTQTQWRGIKKLSYYLNQRHRNGAPVNYDTIVELLKKTKGPEHLLQYFARCAQNEDAPLSDGRPPQEEPSSAQSSAEQGLAQFIKDPSLTQKEIKLTGKNTGAPE